MKDEETLGALFETALSDDDDDKESDGAGGAGGANSKASKVSAKAKAKAKKAQKQEKMLLELALSKDPAAKAARHDDPNRKGSRGLERAIEDTLVRSLVASRLDGMVQEVASRAFIDRGTLGKPPKVLNAGGQLREQPVWGMDSYSRYNVRLALEDSAPFREVIATLETGKVDFFYEDYWERIRNLDE